MWLYFIHIFFRCHEKSEVLLSATAVSRRLQASFTPAARGAEVVYIEKCSVCLQRFFTLVLAARVEQPVRC